VGVFFAKTPSLPHGGKGEQIKKLGGAKGREQEQERTSSIQQQISSNQQLSSIQKQANSIHQPRLNDTVGQAAKQNLLNNICLFQSLSGTIKQNIMAVRIAMMFV
jgi:hypothetical protein